MLSLKEIANVLGVNNFSSVEDCDCIKNISTDTRTIKKGDLYLPLKGENFDGENFITKALEAGAIGYLYTDDKNFVKTCDGVFAFKVEDTKEAYLKLANYYRKKINPKVIMITGSSGKTTTKELVYSVVSQKYQTVKTSLNHNNEIGFCQTVFSMDNNTEVLIIEAGMRGLGEIELISKYAEPDISVISNVGTAHIGRLGSRENIAKAKCEITSYQNQNGILISHDDELIKSTVSYNGQKQYYSISDVIVLKKSIGYSQFSYNDEVYELKIEGDYNIENSLAAINVGKYLGINYNSIKTGLADYKPIEKRWEVVNIAGYNVINDSYNANPESMKAALSTILDLYSDAAIVLGDMGELGEDEIKYHKEIGDYINKTKKTTPILLTVGNLSKYISDEVNICYSKHFNNNSDVANYIRDNIKTGTTIFFKASRAMKFEEIINNLRVVQGDVQ